MKYRGFEIKKEQAHYVVIMRFSTFHSCIWREDTVEEAKREIDKYLDNLTHDDFGKEET